MRRWGLIPLMALAIAVAFWVQGQKRSNKELMGLLKAAEPPEKAIRQDRRLVLRTIGEGLVRHLPKDFVTRPTETLKELRSMPKILRELISTQQDVERIFLCRERLYKAALSLTALELAVGAFQQKERKLPKSLQELSPIYLHELLADPVSRKPFIYRVVNGKPQIYSVGLNGKDEGGKGDDVTARLWERMKDPTFKRAYFSP